MTFFAHVCSVCKYVWFFMSSYCIYVMLLNHLPPKVPATVCKRIHAPSLNAGKQKNSVVNAARDAMRMMRRLGVGWRVPLDTCDVRVEDNSHTRVTYLDPRKLVTYLVETVPSLFLGSSDVDHGKACLEAFWGAYRTGHDSHVVYELFPDELSHCIPIAVHGDEGRGKRRSSTTLISFESVIGLKGHTSACKSCQPFGGVPSCMDGVDNKHRLAKQLRTNLKGHSFIQHFPFCIIPGVLGKQVKTLTDTLLQMFAQKLEDLFNEGFEARSEHWRLVVVACKGDLKWHTKTCNFERSYESRGRQQALSACHLCYAGIDQLPTEDLNERPCWEHTTYGSRPWSESKPPLMDAIPYDPSKPEAMYKTDEFHTLRLGTYRHFTASAIFLYLRYGFLAREAR